MGYERDLKRERAIALAEQAATGLKTWSQPRGRAPYPKRRAANHDRAVRAFQQGLLETKANDLLYGGPFAVLLVEEFTCEARDGNTI